MIDTTESPTASRLSRGLPLIGLALLLAAWGAYFAGQHHASQLDLSRFAECEDICDALARDGYVARHQLPYFSTTIMLDGLALVPLIGSCVCARAWLWGAAAALLWLPSAGWHGLCWLVTLGFAS